MRDGRGNTLLHTVCKQGHLDCLKWLATGFCAGLLSMENDDCFTPADLAVKVSLLFGEYRIYSIRRPEALTFTKRGRLYRVKLSPL